MREFALKDKEYQLLGFFRQNARMSLTKLSKATRMPVSTIFDRLKYYEGNNLIRKHTTLIDFKKLGYDIRTQMLLTADKDSRETMQKFLIMNPRVNTIFRVNNGYDFLIEAIFKDIRELDEFTRSLEDYKLKEKKEFLIMEDVKREEFLMHKDNLGVQR